MLPVKILNAIERIPGLDEAGSELKQTLHELILSGGEPARAVADLLHGTWLGHPLHPPLTDIVVGGWTLGTVFDVAAALTGNPIFEHVADRCIEAGTIAAVPTALAGVTDYSTVQKPATAAATAHAVLNEVALVLYILSIRARRRGNRRRGIWLASVSIPVVLASSWLGGHLTFGKKVGADHSESFDGPEVWTAVLDAADVAVGQPQRVDVDGQSVVVYRSDGSVYAIGGVCSHAGAPLEDGTFGECTVQCPWHDSVFDLRDGSIVHGPATHVQPAFDARMRDGQVEVRLKRT